MQDQAQNPLPPPRRGPPKSRMQRLLGRAKRARCLIKGADPAAKLKLGGYLAWDLAHHTLGVPVRPFDMRLNLSGLDVTVRAFSSQLGAYTDIFHLGEYERVPGFTSARGDIVVDAGANAGFFTLRHAPMVGPSGRVYAFEPNAEVLELLERNVRVNGLSQVRAFKKALSERSGVIRFSSDQRTTSCGHVSTEGEGGELVECTTLDELVEQEQLPRIDLLKMDVEGHEPHVVRGGMRRALAITRRIVMESHLTRDEVWRLLEPLGFEKVYDGFSPNVVYFARPAIK